MTIRLQADPRFHKNQKLSARELQRVSDLASRTERGMMGGEGGSILGSGGFGMSLPGQPEFWIEITDKGPDNLYTWRAVRRNSTDTGWEPQGEGFDSTYLVQPAIEIRGNPSVPFNTVVRAWIGEDGDSLYFFWDGGGTTSTTTYNGPVIYNSEVYYTGSPPYTINSDSNAFDPGGYPVVRVAVTTAGNSFNGLLAPTYAGARVLLINEGPHVLTINDENATPDPLNRLWTPYRQPVVFAPNFACEFYYDGQISRWRLIWCSDMLAKGQEVVSLNADVNNWDIDLTYCCKVLAPTVPVHITGIKNGKKGYILYLANKLTTETVWLDNDSGSSDANNRIICPGGDNYPITEGAGVVLFYDHVNEFWRVLSPKNRLVSTQIAYGDSQNIPTSSDDLTRYAEGSVQQKRIGDGGDNYPIHTLLRRRAADADLQNGDMLARWEAWGKFGGVDGHLGGVQYVYTGDGTTGDSQYEVWVAEGGVENCVLLGQSDGTLVVVEASTGGKLLGTDSTDGHVIEVDVDGVTIDIVDGVLTVLAAGGAALTNTYIGFGSALNQLTGASDFRRLSEALVVLGGQSDATYPSLSLTTHNANVNMDDGEAMAYLYFSGRHSGDIQGGVRFQGYVQSAASATAKVLEIGVGITDTATVALQVMSNGELRVGTANTASKLLGTNASGNVAIVSTLDASNVGITNITLSMFAANVADTDGTLATNSDSRVPTQKAVKTYVDNAVTGLWDVKGATDCSGNPNYPAALKGDAYVVTVAGKIGGASGRNVDIGDVYVALADNAGGTQAAVGTSWFIIEHNLEGVAVTSSPLSQFAATTSAQLADVISDETGTGLVVFNNGPTLIAPVLGTPASGTLTNCTGLPPATGLTGFNGLTDAETDLTDEVPVYRSAGSTNANRKVTWSRMAGFINRTVAEGRLTLESGVTVSTSDQSAKTSLYYAPHEGTRIGLYDGTRWKLYTFAQVTLASPTLTSLLPYDVFLYDNSGTLTLELTAWTNATTRATALTTQDGVLVKSGAVTRRYLGTVLASATNQMSDTKAFRGVWNCYNRRHRPFAKDCSGSGYTYSTAAFRAANNDTANKLTYVCGLLEDSVVVNNSVYLLTTTSASWSCNGIGVNSTTVDGSTQQFGPHNFASGFSGSAFLGLPRLGANEFTALECGAGAGTQTWYPQAGKCLGGFAPC